MNRINKLITKMKEVNMNQIIISDPINIYYLTGSSIDPGERFYALLVSCDIEPILFINQMFGKQDSIKDVVYYDDADNPLPLLSEKIDESKKIGIDKTLNAKFLIPILKNLSLQDYDVSYIVDELRASKDEEEIKLMEESSHINDMAMEEIKHYLKEGITEREVSEELLRIYRRLGAEDYSFSPCVGFGKNSSITHHEPDETKLKKGDFVLIDTGCKYKRYCSDMTRQFIFKGKPSQFQKKIYDICRKSTETAEKICRPGIELCMIDQAARDVIEQAGYGKNFSHRTGHFIGLEDHDFGDVSSNNHNLTEVGNIFSIEPSIALENEFTMYVEDLVLITEDGCKVLNQYTHELEIIE